MEIGWSWEWAEWDRKHPPACSPGRAPHEFVNNAVTVKNYEAGVTRSFYKWKCRKCGKVKPNPGEDHA